MDLIERLRREADISTRPGQMDRLNALADEFADALEAARNLINVLGATGPHKDSQGREKISFDDLVNSGIPFTENEYSMLISYGVILPVNNEDYDVVNPAFFAWGSDYEF